MPIQKVSKMATPMQQPAFTTPPQPVYQGAQGHQQGPYPSPNPPHGLGNNPGAYLPNPQGPGPVQLLPPAHVGDSNGLLTTPHGAPARVPTAPPSVTPNGPYTAPGTPTSPTYHQPPAYPAQSHPQAYPNPNYPQAYPHQNHPQAYQQPQGQALGGWQQPYQQEKGIPQGNPPQGARGVVTNQPSPDNKMKYEGLSEEEREKREKRDEQAAQCKRCMGKTCVICGHIFKATAVMCGAMICVLGCLMNCIPNDSPGFGGGGGGLSISMPTD